LLQPKFSDAPLHAFGMLSMHAVMQTTQQAVLVGGCQICTGTSTRPDPSTSDSADLWTLDIRSLTQSALQSRNLSAHWTLQRTLGFPHMPPRKGFGVEAVGCSARDAQAICSLFIFGGWNPRWPADFSSTAHLQKLDVGSMTWSILPTDGDLVRTLNCVLPWMDVPE
jgi:hypothetical protein